MERRKRVARQIQHHLQDGLVAGQNWADNRCEEEER